jgi:carotenoid cleavage dioxygenase-like enzyme
LVAGKFVENKPIGDLFEQRKRFQVLADANGQADFFRMTPDNLTIQLWRNGQMKAVDLDQPLATYDSKSLQGILNADGTAWIVLKVDPVNADAVARKKADPEYLDIFKVGADGKAVRKARILAKGVRHRFGLIGDMFWLLERSTGFDRGGKALTVYSLAS